MKKIYLLLFLVSFIILAFKLGDAPLLSYDEAWYAEISRNLLTQKNPLLLTFNGKAFTDHPPFGFILMSIPTLFLGSNEFSVRFASVILGSLSISLIFLIGKKLNNTASGIIAATVLLSSLWFVFRARSGNLDVPLVFFGILTVYFLLNKKKGHLYLGITSFACTLLIKTLVGIGILPITLLLLYKYHFRQLRTNYKKILFIILIIILPWYIYNQFVDPNFLHHHFFDVGIRGQENAYSIEAIKNSLYYLSIGIGKWYKLFIVSSILLLIDFALNKKHRDNILTIFFWFFGFSIFIISKKTEIWHLLPIYPAIALSISLIPKMISNLLKISPNLLEKLFVAFVLIVGIYQYHQFSNLIYTNQNAYSNEKDISVKAGKYENVYLLDTFMPASIYYSQKHVTSLHWDVNAFKSLTDLLEKEKNNVFIINEKIKNQLESNKIYFQILEKNNSYYIISN